MPLPLLALFVLGACLGSLINLGIYRLAYFRQRISPWCRVRSSHPKRTWVDQIPIVGWWSLRREEKFHGAGFWIRPMLIELAFGIGIAALYWLELDKFIVNQSAELPGLQPGAAEATALVHQFAIHVLLLVLMMLATFIDIDEQTIPDSITVPGTLLALLLAAWCTSPALPSLVVDFQQPRGDQLVSPLCFDYPKTATAFLKSWSSLAVDIAIYWMWCFALLPRRWRLHVSATKAWRVMWRRIFARDEWRWVLPLAVAGTAFIGWSWSQGGEMWRGLTTALIGLAVGGGLIWVIRVVGSAVLKREAMGFGDVTLMAMIGAFYGWQPIILVFFLAPFAGAVVGVFQVLTGEENVIPYGPYLCLAALVVLIFWSPIWDYSGRMFEIPWLVPSAIAVCLPLLVILLYGWKLIRDRIRGG